jgi:glutamate racemase
MKIGVFDSGVGGLSVVRAIEKSMPEHKILFLHDAAHFPYARRSPNEILGFVVPILQELVDDGCKVIVIACNTVSTTLITELRQKISVPLVAVEPMIKPAAEQTTSKVIAVCATPTTLASDRYTWLKDHYAQGVTVLEPDCSEWSSLIERNAMDEQTIRGCIEPVIAAKADIIVLGCTHYHWIEEEIKAVAAGRATVLQPEQPVVQQLRNTIETLDKTV